MSRKKLCFWLLCSFLFACVSTAVAEQGKGRGRGKHHRSREQAGAQAGTPDGAGQSGSHDEDRGALAKIPKQWYEGTVEMAGEKGAAAAQKFLWLKDVSGVMYLVAGGRALERLRKEAVGQHLFVWARSWTNERGEKCLKVSQFEKAVGTLPTESPKHHRRAKGGQSASTPAAPAEPAGSAATPAAPAPASTEAVPPADGPVAAPPEQAPAAAPSAVTTAAK
jgi:hypothetical protein